jgi:translocator protein
MSLVIGVFALWAIVLAGIGGLLTDVGPWYRELRKPSWQPPDWAFGPAWTIILGLTAWAGVLGWEAATDDAARLRIVILFLVNGALHLLWSPLFFRWHRPDWALFEVVFLWLSVLALVVGLAPLSAGAAWFALPYLLWVSFASYLNLTIVRLNRPFRAG